MPRTANPGGIAGTASGFFAAALFRFVSTPASSARALCGRSNNSNAGWYIYAGATHNQLYCRMFNGVGTSVNSPIYSVVAGDLDKVCGVVAVHDGSYVRLYVNRVEVGSGTAIVGYTAHAQGTEIGGQGNGAGAYNISSNSGPCQLFGVTGGAGIPSLANVQAWFDACKSNYTCSAMPSVGSEHRWLCTSATSPIADVGTVPEDASYTPSGMSVVTLSNPTWGW